MIAEYLGANRPRGGTLLDVGCGSGALRAFVRPLVTHYVGADLIRYDSFPADCEFYLANFDSGPLPLSESFADVVVAAEIVEHLENPRALMRELARVVKPGGWILITTPNQLSLLSLLTLMTKHRFAAFQDVHYPAHLTALLEVDLLRMASEIELVDVAIEYSRHGRIPKTPWHYPGLLNRLWPRGLSDNLLVVGRKASMTRAIEPRIPAGILQSSCDSLATVEQTPGAKLMPCGRGDVNAR
jgi:2-polyprenyl-3-methyl-5-hydroxy-6-metoxy-1,4-benzoquinol methylase